MAGGVLIVGLGKLLHFYDETEAIAAIDFNTLGLLLGMMILVALLEPTGFFPFLAVWAGRLSRGRPVWLLVLLGTITTLVSMFLDNVTTVVLIAPVTMLIAGFGGNGTIIGSTANIVVATLSERTRTPITSALWNKRGLPFVLATCTAASILYILFYPFLNR